MSGIGIGDTSSMTHRDVNYRQEQLRPTREALAGWTLDRNNDRGVGQCVECAGEMSWQFEPTLIAHGPGSGDPDGASQRVTCACRNTHRGTPEGTVGCGRSWIVRVLPDGNEPPIVPETDPIRMDIADQIGDITPQIQEQMVRAAAEKWVGAVTVLLGLFGLSGIAFGKDVFTNLGPYAREVLAIALGLAVVFAAASVLLIHKAAFGWPHSVDVSTGTGLSDFDIRRRKAAQTAACNLRSGVYLALGSLLALCVGAGAVFSSGFQTRTELIEVTRHDDSQVCGHLLPNAGTGALRIRRDDGSVETVTADTLSKLVPATKCSKS